MNEYRKQNPREFFGDDGSLVVLTWKDFIELNRLILISKEYEFIKWLVENDKIDESKIFCDQWLYYSLLCKLAISDTPIEDLISYLK